MMDMDDDQSTQIASKSAETPLKDSLNVKQQSINVGDSINLHEDKIEEQDDISVTTKSQSKIDDTVDDTKTKKESDSKKLMEVIIPFLGVMTIMCFKVALTCVDNMINDSCRLKASQNKRLNLIPLTKLKLISLKI